MISNFAMGEIRKLERETGMKVSPEDVVRLNALGLKCDHAVGVLNLYRLRRSAEIGRVTLREPTIAHELWISSLGETFDFSSRVTLVVVTAFALSMEADKLPQHWTKSGLDEAIGAFLKTMFEGVTFPQLENAVAYVRQGVDHCALEVAPPRKDPDAEEDLDPQGDTDAHQWNFAAGVLHEGVALSLGSIDELKRMTLAELEETMTRAIYNRITMTHGSEEANRWKRNRETDAHGRFCLARDEIKARLLKEKEAKANG